MAKSKSAAKNLIVVQDDLDMALGTQKLTFDRGSGGHNGIKSVELALRTQKFVRIRVGITPINPKGILKKPKGRDAVHEFIVGNFKKSECTTLEKLSLEIGDAIALLISEGRPKAMSLYN